MTPEARKAIESILMVADQPVDASVLAQLLEVPRADVEAACAQLAAEYEQSERGFILAQVAGGYRFQSHPELAPYVERFVLDGQSSRLSNAALETLAIVAYKQPISRMQIAAIRGVNVDGVLRTLQQRGYVDELSRDPGPGNAVLFGTTSLFLERVGLNGLADLPPLAEFVPGADVVEALEDGLRPEPVSELVAEAAAMAQAVEADAGEHLGDTDANDADIDLTDPELGSAPSIDMRVDRVAADVVAPQHVSTDSADTDSVSTDSADTGSADTGGADPESGAAAPEPPASASPLAEPPMATVIRHELPGGLADEAEVAEVADVDPAAARPADPAESAGGRPTVPFRTTPGAGTGGQGVTAATDVGVGETQGSGTAAPSPLNPDVD